VPVVSDRAWGSGPCAPCGPQMVHKTLLTVRTVFKTNRCIGRYRANSARTTAVLHAPPGQDRQMVRCGSALSLLIVAVVLVANVGTARTQRQHSLASSTVDPEVSLADPHAALHHALGCARRQD
jgi:hypothetical protein